MLLLSILVFSPLYSWAFEDDPSHALKDFSTPPTAMLSTPSSDITITAGDAVIFTGTAIGAPPFTYWWELGGNGGSALEDPGSVIFSTPGVYPVIFYVKDSLGNVAWDTVTVTVTPSAGPPVAMIETPLSDLTVTQGGSIDFSGSAIGGSGSYLFWWQFAALGGSALEDPGSFTFNVPGVFTVIFYVQDSLGVVALDTITVTVTASGFPLSATIGMSASLTIAQGESVNCQATVTGGSGAYLFWWQFDTLGGSALEDPGNFTFTTPGVYTVIFYVQDSLGVMASDTVTITVNEKSGADLTGGWKVTMEGIPTYYWNNDSVLYSDGTFASTIYVEGSINSYETGTWSYDDSTNVFQFSLNGSATYGYGAITGTTTNFTIPGFAEGNFVTWRIERQTYFCTGLTAQ